MHDLGERASFAAIAYKRLAFTSLLQYYLSFLLPLMCKASSCGAQDGRQAFCNKHAKQGGVVWCGLACCLLCVCESRS